MNEPVTFVSGTVGKKCLGDPLLENPPYMPGEHTHTHTESLASFSSVPFLMVALRVCSSTSLGKSRSWLKPQDAVHEQRADAQWWKESAPLRRPQPVRVVPGQVHLWVSLLSPCPLISCWSQEEHLGITPCLQWLKSVRRRLVLT